MRSPVTKGLVTFWPSGPVTAWTVPLSKVPTNSVPLSPHAICRAWGTPLAHTAILKPGGSLMVARILSSSARGVGVGWPGLGAWPFCSLFSSPRNQSGGGLSQKSLVLESYFLRS
jgi:hypothetical protein